VKSFIEAKNLSKKFGTLTALDNVTFHIRQGERVALLGANGAGKSTFFNILLGFLKPDQGNTKLFETPSRQLPPETKARFSYISEESALPPWSTPRGLSLFFSDIYPKWDGALMEQLISAWKINQDKSCKSMSKGQRRLAEIALFLSTTPDLLLLDEPFDGLDALMRLTVIGALLEINTKRGLTVLFSSHIVSEAPRLSERIIVLKEGRVAMDSPLSSLKNPLETDFLALHATV
jgi:ABC-2 type transport system ATP-binding protein